MSFFIDRPIFAMVLSIVIVLCGYLAMTGLPIAQYPEITPPTIVVTTTYPGANARDVAAQVATPIEKEINGVENMLYMESKSTNDGQLNLTITFNLGTNLDMAQVLVQNRVSLALPKLPDAVKQQGVSVKKSSPSIILCVSFTSPDGTFKQLDLSNYAAINVRDQLFRLPGVGDVTFLGEREFSMRVWLDPNQVAKLNLTAGDIANAVREQNAQVPAGQIGRPPAAAEQAFQYPVTTRGRLTSAEDFKRIIVKTGADGEIVRMRDVVRPKFVDEDGEEHDGVELAAKNADVGSTLSGLPSVSLAVYQLPGSNALATADGIRSRMAELSRQFPPGIKYAIEYDTTGFVRTSIETVVHTLFEAVVLVFIVVMVFLQSWRASLIPLIAVPVAIIGTFAVMAMLGFSINNLTLFGMVLAIGIVVDDAIVVVENVEHHMAHGLPVKEATHKAMREVSGPIIAVTLVLAAVFIPTAFIPGITGQFFRQFALTIAVSALISGFNSLTLSPALCPLLLKHKGESRDPLTWLFDLVLGKFFQGFNWVFDRSTKVYTNSVGLLLRLSAIVLLIYVGLLGLTYVGFTTVPGGFIPQQDKGYLIMGVQLPDGASLERTRKVVARIDDIVRKVHGVKSTLGVFGMSFLINTNGSNLGSMFVILDPFEDRDHGPSADEVAAEIRKQVRGIESAQIVVFGAPPVDGLGNASGFKMQVQARQPNISLLDLQKSADDLVRAANARPQLLGLSNAFRANTPQLFVRINEAKAKMMGVAISEINQALQIYLGSLYVNDVTLFNNNYQVNLQADQRFRRQASDIKRLQVRNRDNEMVPLATVIDVEDSSGPALVSRFNMFPSAAVSGLPAPGVSSSQAIKLMEQQAGETLPQGVGYEWTELTLLQILAGNTAIIVFALAVVLVFLVLSAQYESWSLPMAVILVVPMCLLCSIAGVAATKGDMNIFTQIGFVVLVGLASKNAILIVEFAKAAREGGQEVRQATLDACRLRLRPILMTSFAFILGVVPLVLSHGAGAEMRRALGIAVFSGMLGVTVFGIFLTPVFYYVIARFTSSKIPTAKAAEVAEEAPGEVP